MEHKLNTHGSWLYFEVLWSETIGLCKKLNIIYYIITCNPEPQENGLDWCPVLQTNHSFEPVEPTSPNWTEVSEIVRSSIKTHFQTPDSHSDCKSDPVMNPVINSFSAPVPPTVTELKKIVQLEPKTDRW